MPKLGQRTEQIRTYILANISEPTIAAKVMDKFNITRQAANRHLKSLSGDGSVIPHGKTRKRSYEIAPIASETFLYKNSSDLAEDEVWRSDIKPFLGHLPQNVMEIWNYAFTEMFNNAIDHSNAEAIGVFATKSAVSTEILITDNGIGIFKKIRDTLGLSDEKQAIFELSKGKLTTDAARHSGQGIFFTSRMVNGFDIVSGGAYFNHEISNENDRMRDLDETVPGTSIFLRVDNHTARTVKKVYAKYSVKNSYGFNKTVVPVKLAKYGTDQLVSRSQAKRVLVRVDQFSQVIFDFKDIDMIGQAFADEIFRVFAAGHPKVELLTAHANKQIMGLIQSTIKSGRPGFKGAAISSSS